MQNYPVNRELNAVETEAMGTMRIVLREIERKGSIKKHVFEDKDFLRTSYFKGEKLFSA